MVERVVVERVVVERVVVERVVVERSLRYLDLPQVPHLGWEQQGVNLETQQDRT